MDRHAEFSTDVNSRPPGAFVLVIVMFMLAMIFILVMAFATSMRTERIAATNMAQGQRADLMVDSAIAHAVSLLANNIPDPTDPTQETPIGAASNWFINPGKLTVVSQTGAKTEVLLYSGKATAADPITAANLNAPSPATGKYPITGSDDPMWVSWVNVLKDPTKDGSASNPIVGRYAFWIDDECAKINFNVARGKPSDIGAALPSGWGSSTPRDLQPYLTPTFTIGSTKFALGHPASINLDSLGVDVQKLQSDVASRGFLGTPEAIKGYLATSTADPEVFFEANKFSLTPFSRSPEFNVFGKSRLFMLPKEADLAAGPVYQHISDPDQQTLFWADGAGMGDDDSDERRRVREPVVTALAKYLERNDWPGYGGSSFRWTTNAIGSEGVYESEQIALNIANMGYWATISAASGGAPYPAALTNKLYRTGYISGAYPGATRPNDQIWRSAITEKPVFTIHPGPLLTELAFQIFPRLVTASSSQWYLSYRAYPEFTLPAGHFRSDNGTLKYYSNGGSNNYKLRFVPTYLRIEVTPDAGASVYNEVRFDDSGSALTALRTELPAQVLLDDYTERTGGIVYVSNLQSKLSITTGASTNQRARFTGSATVKVKLRLCVATVNGSKITQVVPLYVPQAESASTPPELFPPSAVDEEATFDYTFRVNAGDPNTFLPIVEHIQSFELDDPRLFAKKEHWTRVASVSQTDNHSLGEENSSSTFNASGASEMAMWDFSVEDSHSTSKPFFRGSSIGMFSLVPAGMHRGIPWETLRFYQYTPGLGELPDWLVLDLLAPTYPAPISLRNSTAGKINLNSKIYPDTDPYFTPPARTSPIEAALKHMPNGTLAAAKIADYQNTGGFFDYIGRLCEVSGLADGSLAADTNNPTEFEKEVIIRNLASLFTTQSNTFGVWGVAQTVKKKKSNTSYGSFESGDVVTGERRFYVVIERYVWPGKDGEPGNAKIDSGIYAATATGMFSKPGAPPSMGAKWADIDGKQGPDLNPIMGTVSYTSSSSEEANNPLAALMKYKIIYFAYLD